MCDGGINNAQEFLGIIDSSVFRGEARFRLSELAFLLTRYSPAYIEKMGVTGQVSDAAVREVLSKIIDSSEFEKVVASEGRLGYIKHPEVGLSRLKRAIIGLTSRKDFRSAVRAGVGVAELAPGLGPISVLKDVLPKAEEKHHFSPLFLDLPMSAHAAISRSALAEAYPEAVPSKGSIFLEEHIRGNRASHQWLNEGEEQKLVDNPKKDLAHRVKSAKNARGALMHIVEPSEFPDHRRSKPLIYIHRHRHS